MAAKTSEIELISRALGFNGNGDMLSAYYRQGRQDSVMSQVARSSALKS